MVEGGDELTLERDDGSGTRRPRALWAVLAALAVLAGTLAVVAASGDGDGTPKALPVALGGAGFGGGEGAMSADMSMAAWITYGADDRLPSLGGEAPAYRVTSDADEGRVQALADVLGIPGQVVPAPEGPWRVESDGAVLEVYGDGLSGWWYGAGGGSSGSSSGSAGSSGAGWAPHPDAAQECIPGPAVDCAQIGQCTVTQSPDGSTVEECVSQGPIVPTDLPSREEAQALALDLLSATGLDVDDVRVTVEGPFDAWYVMVEPVLDGVPVSGWMSTVGVGSKGVIVSASGTLATAERVDDYPLLDTRATLDRLNAQSAGFGGPKPLPLPAPEVEVEVEVEVESGAASATATTACILQPDGREVCEHATTTAPCAAQPDGREVCEVPGAAPVDRGECVETAVGEGPDRAVSSSCVAMACPPQPGSGEAPSCPPSPDCAAPAADPATEPATTVPTVDCGVAPPPILPEPEPLEVVLTGAERVLILAPAIDDSGVAYLVPGYRFTSNEGHTVDVMAVTDEVLAPTPAPAVTEPPLPPETTEIAPRPGEATCETSVPGEACGDMESSDPDVVHLSEGEEPQMGVPYYVDVDVQCGAFDFAGVTWRKAEGDLSGWSTPHEGGRFTLDSATSGTFVGDQEGTKTAKFVADHAGDGCIPTPRT